MYRFYFIPITCLFLVNLFCDVMCKNEKYYHLTSSIHAEVTLLNITCDSAINSTEDLEDANRSKTSRSIRGYSLPNTNDDFTPLQKLTIKLEDHDYDYFVKNNSSDIKNKYSRSSSSQNDFDEQSFSGIYLQDVNVKKLENRSRTNTSVESKTGDDTSDIYLSDGSILEPVITDEVIDGNITVEVEIRCNEIVFGPNAISQNVEHVSIESRGRITFHRDWASSSSKLKTIKVYSSTEVQFPGDCSWLPKSVTDLDLSRSYLKSLNLLKCVNSSLETLTVGLSPSLSSLSLCLPSLVILSASWGSIDKIKTNCQEGNAKVVDLNLSRNKLTSFTTCGWPSLVDLDLNSNKISQVNFITCSSPGLTTIDISYNRLTMSPESLPSSVHKINLSRNRIKKLSIFNQEIQEIDLSHNELTTIGKGAFKNAWTLLTLDLSHNKIEVIYGHTFYGLYELQSLDLSRNRINHVRHEALLPLQALQKLNLDHNQLKKLDSRLLTSLSSSLELRVKHNPWRCSCHLLAKLHHVIRSHCKPHCHKVDELECLEGSSLFSAQSILERCIEARNEIPIQKTVDDKQMQRHIKDCDEDISEEDISEPSSTMSSYAIAGILLVILLPATFLGLRTLYLKRKSICGRFNFLDPPTTATAIPQWSSNDKDETDSETEM